MKDDQSKSVTLLSLIAVILSAGVFKEEMSHMYLWSGSWSLLTIFIAFALLYGLLLLCYLILEFSPETPGYRFLSKYSKNVKSILNMIFLVSLTLILIFSATAVLLAILVFEPRIITLIIYIVAAPLIFKQIMGLALETKALIVIIRSNKDAE